MFHTAPSSVRVVEDAHEVVEADELPVAQTGPVREGEEPTGQRGDVVDADHQDDRGQRPPPVPVADQRLAAACGRGVRRAPGGTVRVRVLFSSIVTVICSLTSSSWRLV